MRYQFIAIEGNIGVGKSTLANLLAKKCSFDLILEQFEDNPFLPKFYEQQERYAFSLELFFMAERYQQLGALNTKNMFSKGIIADYFFLKSKLFAQNNLDEDELLLFNKLSDIAIKNLPKPELLVYLHSSVDRLQENIKKRGRQYEQKIEDVYLRNIENIYFDYFKKQNETPVLILDVTEVDFVLDEGVFDHIYSLLDNHFEKGIHHFKL